MKKIIYTQRVEQVPDYQEKRDCTDQELPKLLFACGYLPISIANIPELVSDFLNQVKPDGILLTGGNDLYKYGGTALERDETESLLLKYSLQQDIPVFGFCRGMQVIADYFGCTLKKVKRHVRETHTLSGIYQGENVNSYHRMAIDAIKAPLIATSWAEDGSIESIKHEYFNISGVMWHPEREKPYKEKDLQRIRYVFG